MMGGNVKIESEEEVGTKVTVFILKKKHFRGTPLIRGIKKAIRGKAINAGIFLKNINSDIMRKTSNIPIN